MPGPAPPKLARKLGVARTTVLARLTGLQGEGVIVGFTARLAAREGLDAKRLLVATEGRDHQTVLDFAADLNAHGGDADQVRHVCMDMSAAYAKGGSAAAGRHQLRPLPCDRHGPAQTGAMYWLQRSALESARAWRLRMALREVYARSPAAQQRRERAPRRFVWNPILTIRCS